MTLSFLGRLTDIMEQAFVQCDLPAELGRMRVSDRPDLAQFQCNGAMAAAKLAKKNPRDIAQMIVDKLQETHGDIFAKIEIAGPGFLNISLTTDIIGQWLGQINQDPRYGVQVLTGQVHQTQGAAPTIILDYGGPNIAKPMHVGHLRASIIGDSLRRICGFAGYKTLGDVHMGDWGTHMGMIISEYIKTGQQENVLSLDLDDEAAIDTFMQELSVMYPKVAGACKEDEARKDLAREATVKIQQKDPEHYALWQKIQQASIIGMRRNFAALNVHFDLWKGEADVHDYIAPMVDDLTAKNLAYNSDGAIVIDVAQDDDKKEMPPLILYKKDGAVLYGTTDMATIVERVKLYNPEKCVYIVDQRQHMHFEQVFRAVKKSGIASQSMELTHAGFGTMNGTDGKPFKTRAGGVMKLEDLIAMAVDKANARMDEAHIAQDMSAQDRADIAHKIGVAAIKFADLQNNRISDYVFDLDRFMQFEGKTGPYLLYQTVRIKSLLRKAADQGLAPSDDFVIQDKDTDLALTLAGYEQALALALEHYAPHYLAEYIYRLAASYSSFYGNCHILTEENTAICSSRLGLSALTVKILEHSLGLLGIDVPERM